MRPRRLFEPAAEALLDLFHVDRQVAEALLDGFEPGQSERVHAQSAELLQLLPQQADEFLAVERAQVLEEPLLTDHTRETLEPDLAPRHLHQRVEGVAHDAVGDEPDAGELRHFPEQATQGLLFHIIESDLATAGAGRGKSSYPKPPSPESAAARLTKTVRQDREQSWPGSREAAPAVHRSGDQGFGWA